MCGNIDTSYTIVDETDEEKMHHADKPERSERDQSVREERAFSLLDVFSDDIAKREPQESYGIDSSIDPEIAYHPVPMQVYISIDDTIEDQKDTKKEEKIRMSH